MGSTPESSRYLLSQLERRPDTVEWCSPQPVTLHRGADNKLGFHFKTYRNGSDKTLTVVVRVKPGCRIVSGLLDVGDRIINISNYDVTGLGEDAVKHVLKETPGALVHLQVSAMNRADPNSQVKRFLSFHSGASDNSVTASVDSAERPQVKRLAKSTSVETPPPSSPVNDFDQPGVTTPHSPRCMDPRNKDGDGGGKKGSPARYLSHLNPHSNGHIHSLPTRMEDDIILTDDIVLSEADGPHSLPPVLTPLPNTPCAHASSFFTNTVSTGIGGCSGTASFKSLGVEVCRAPGCSLQKMCLWHKFVLTYPQYVVWDPFTKTVTLDKKDSVSFGFKYKVKVHDGPPAEVFALVTEVVNGGVAWTQLLPGDWIRSINSTPVNTAKEAFHPDFRKLSSLRLVIQRPDGLSPKGEPRLRQQAKSMRVKLYIPPAPSSDPFSSFSPQPSNNLQPSPASYQQYVSPVRAGGDVGVVGRSRNPNPPVSPDLAVEQYPRLAQSPGEHILLNTLTRSVPPLNCTPSVVDKCVLPRARVVVCGAHGSAVDFVRGLFGEREGMSLNPEANVQSFHLSLHHSADFGTMVHPHPESLMQLIRDRELGGRQSQGGGLRCMNIELHVINDEEFFHHCSAWLLPSSALVLLTFNIHKLLNQPEPETRRLATMVHTVRACSDSLRSGAMNAPCPEVLLYGVPAGLQRDASAEEVQAIFYVTDAGSRLLEHHALAVPSVAVPACGESMAAARQKIFSICQDRVCEVPVHQPVVKVVDMLSGSSGVKVSGREVSALVSRVTGDADPVVLHAVVQDLLATGSLLACGGNKGSGQEFEDSYLLPANVFQALSSLLIKPFLDSYSPECRQKWFKVMTTGRASRSELLDLIASESNLLTLDLLELLGIAFRFQASSLGAKGDSGFAEDAVDFVIPYFLMDTANGSCESDGQRFVMTFDSYVTWRGYFDMLCRLSALPATEEVVLHGQYVCVVKHNGLRLVLHWRKSCDSNPVIVSAARLDHQAGEGSVTSQTLQRLFSFVVPPGTPFHFCPASTANPSGDLPSLLDLPRSVPPRPDHNEEDTPLKPVAASAESMANPRSPVRLTALPWSVLNNVAIHLSIPMPSGHDWKSVAGEAGKSIAEIQAYEVVKSTEVPAMTFLREWILTGTIQQFLDILDRLERPDIRDIITNHFESRANSQP
ncbi:uncharacterized protein [Littorina saxatilis]|uniref:PDZ domain-containing protein n=1 Tax=Littorina saxatilis TaxID=31220 RepID=A0AAN9GBS4_9CAEN